MFHTQTTVKKSLFLLLLMALLMPWQAKAQETLTVCNGTTTNNYIPINGMYVDTQGTTSEFILPAGTDGMDELIGGAISKLTFYVTNSPVSWGTPVIQVYMGEVESTTLSNLNGPANFTVVYEGVIDNTQSSMEIEFDTPYTYEGGNLLIGTYVKTKAGWKTTTYSGVSAPSGSSRYNNGSGNGTDQSFLPKTTFTYEPASTGGCAKPKQFNASDITAHTATLTWTAGDDGQSNWDVYVTEDATIVPDENTTPTYQVTECSKDLSGLTAQTTYYVYVRAVCATDDKSKWANKTFTTTREALTVDSNNPYSQNFETNNDWGFENGTLTNKWCWSSAVNNGGAKAMYVSKDGGTSYEYEHGNTAIYASKLFSFAQGTYTFFFNWNAKGESTYDYLRVALAPGDVEFAAGTNLYPGVGTTSLPNNWIALDGGSKLNLSDSWQTLSAEATVSGTYTMVFIWRNDGSGGTQPPAAIDNISISYMTCPRPTSLTSTDVTGRTATLSWTENGTATNWVLQYATNNTFTENLVEVNVTGTASKSLSGLAPETQYYARVKSVLGTEESSWSDIANFTTLATCPKPTLSYVSYSNTAFSGSVSWTGSTADAFEIAYRPGTTDFDPSDYTLENVTRVQLENVSEYTYTLQELTPETKYYIYIQANCGSEDGLSSWSNRVTFTTLATCLAPSNLTDESVTSTSVNLSWTKGADDQEAWQFRYKKTNETDYTYVLVENHPENTYTLQGLEPATSYYVNVRAWCGGDDYSKWSLANQSMDKTITTACASITLPYSCDFEGAVETGGHFSSHPIPKCWEREEMQSGNYGNYYYYPYVHSQSSEAHGGTKSLRMYRTPNSANQTIILPAIDDAYNMNDLQIRFWAKAGSSDNTLSVGIMDNDNFTEVQLVEGVSTSYTEFTVPLTNYTGNGRNIAIKCGSSSSYLYYNIDDVKVEEIPSCFIPTGLDNTAVTYNTASFVWQPGKDETEWNIQYKKTSDSEWSNPIHVTELPTTENPFVLTGLQRGIEYEARIQAYCDAEDQSEWNSMPISFTTDCGVWPIDAQNALFENFSGDAFPPSCWDWIRVNNYTGWEHSTNVYDPVDPTGTAYSYWPNGDTYLILPHMHINGNAKLNFDMAFSSSGSGEESSVVLSTTGKTALNFSTTLWIATEFPTTKTNVSIDLSDYDGLDVYIAFKFAGVGTSGRTWYIDNVQVYVGEIFTKDITAYTEGSNDRYYLIASPVGEVNPENVANVLANNYDLYYFDQSKELEWINFEGTDGNFNLIPGKGYLYANSGNVTLRFVGQPYNGDGQISLDKVSGAEFEGWNLIGNPFGTNATLDLPYYRMNADGTALNATTETSAVAPMEGVFVIASNDQSATFTATRISPKSVPMLNININRNHSTTIDNAIIRFDEGGILPKFQLNPNSTKIYIPENNQDYAIVRSTGSGELPINFKATRNGRYSISINAEDVEVNYLHLIDNLTGNDVDLLASGSYEFEAKTTDYASRFKLMFNVNEDNLNNQDNFAFYHNGEIIVTGQGTLRVFDALGRQLFTKDLSPLTSHLSPFTSPGVYVIQLIQNDKVKTQKILIP